MSSNRSYDIAVVGAGPAGLAAALSIGHLGLETVLLGPPHRPAGHAEDQRTAALFAGSVELLKNLGAWPHAVPASEPITAIRIVDDRGTLLRAPEVVFPAAEIGLQTLGYNVPNATLILALRNALRDPDCKVAAMATAGVTSVEIGANALTMTLAEGTRVEARLVIGADGRRSICREAAGIAARAWDYPQSAIVASFSHDRPHRGISTEFHCQAGPVTTVPLPGLASSLVWVDLHDEARRLAGLDENAFRSALEGRLQGLLGPVGAITPRSLFPLSGLMADAVGKSRIALVGEAAHAIPPIGAQGLNLGLRDAASLADCLADALSHGRDIGGAETLAAFNASRAFDITSRVWTVDLLNRSLLTEFVPVHLARGLGLHILKTVPALRRLVVREGLQPARAAPSLMQPEGRARLERRRHASGAAA